MITEITNPTDACAPIIPTARLPGIKRIPRSLHRSPAVSPTRWLVPLALIVPAVTIARMLPAWGYMWAIALSIFAASKWITWWPYRGSASTARTLGYLFAWTGMDARRFLAARGVAPPSRRDWLAASGKTALGGAVVAAAHLLFPFNETLAAGLAMVGLVLVLHFGLFHLLALLWQRRGVSATPLMNRPTRSHSLAELWGRRWNTGFSTLAGDVIFSPLRKHPLAATMIVFLVSGIIHDAVISLPARGGYGRPTLYFLIQLIGLLIERTRPARRVGLGRGALGWVYTAAFTLLPLPLLFHEPFVRNVMLPFLHAIGALNGG